MSARRSSTAFAERLPCTNPTHDANAAVSACYLLSNWEGSARGTRSSQIEWTGRRSQIEASATG